MPVVTTKTEESFGPIAAGAACVVNDMKTYAVDQITVLEAGTENVCVLGYDYTLAIAGDFSGVTITPLAPLAARATHIVVVRRTPLTSDFDIAPSGRLNEPRLVEQLDRTLMREQENRSLLDRTVRFASGEDGFVFPPAEQRAGLVFAFDDTGALALAGDLAQTPQASQAEAEAGVVANKWMSPFTVLKSILHNTPVITENQTVTFGAGGTFDSFNDFNDWFHAVEITGRAVITLQVLDGSYDVTTSDRLRIEKNGSRLQVIGNVASKANVQFNVISASEANWACEIIDGAGLRLFDGIVCVGDGWGGAQGLWLANGRNTFGIGGFGDLGQVNVGAATRFEKLYVGARGQGSGRMYIKSGAEFQDNGDAGILGRGAVNITCHGVHVRGVGDAAFNLGHSVIAEQCAYVEGNGIISSFAPAYGGHFAIQGTASADFRECLVGFNPDGTPSTGGGIAFRGLGGPGKMDFKGAVVRDCFGGAQFFDGAGGDGAGALLFDMQVGGFYLETKRGGNVSVGFYKPSDYPQYQGNPVAALALRTGRTASGPTENANDIYVAPGSFTNESEVPTGLARWAGTVNIAGQNYTAAVGRAKSLAVATEGFNGISPTPFVQNWDAFGTNTIVLPAGGSWEYSAQGINASSGVIDHRSGKAAGGTSFTMAAGVTTIRGWCRKKD